MPDTILGTYAPSDSDEALALDAACAQGGALRLSFRRPTFHARASAYPEHVILTARLDGRLVGTLAVAAKPVDFLGRPARAAFAFDLRVHPEARGRGLARRPRPRGPRLGAAARGPDVCLYRGRQPRGLPRLRAHGARGGRWLRLPRLPVGEPAPARGSGPGGLLRGGARGVLPGRGPLRPPRGPGLPHRVEGLRGLVAPADSERGRRVLGLLAPGDAGRGGRGAARAPARGAGARGRGAALAAAVAAAPARRRGAALVVRLRRLRQPTRSSEPISCGTWPGKRAGGASTGATSSTPAATAGSGPCARTFRASSHRSCAIACSCGASTAGRSAVSSGSTSTCATSEPGSRAAQRRRDRRSPTAQLLPPSARPSPPRPGERERNA